MSYRNVISIDIGSCNTKIVVGSFEKGTIHLERAFSFDTVEGSISDGKLIFSEGKADLLRNKIVQALNEHKIKVKNVIFTIQSTIIIRRELEMPRVKPHEMENMIRYEIEQYLPIDLNEYIIEYKILDEKLDGKFKTLIAALPKQIAEGYLNILNSMNRSAVALDINSNAISKLFAFKQQINDNFYDIDNTAAFIDMGHSNINISILSKGLFQFSHLISTGGKELTAGIADVLNISFTNAEMKKHTAADLQNKDLIGEAEVLNQVIINIVSRWIQEIQRVFQFYKTRNANNDINKIYIYGGTSSLRGIGEYMADALSMPVAQINSISSIAYGKQIDSFDMKCYLNSIGAIIRK